MSQKIFFLLILWVFFTGSYFFSFENYKKYLEIQANFIDHPENLPKPEVLKNSSLGFDNAIADMYWLQAIQYIWGNAISSEYRQYLYVMLNLISELNPNFENPYTIWMLLLPGKDTMNPNVPQEDIDKYTQQALEIGKKWIENFCNLDKIALIEQEFDLQKLWTEDQYRNPCKSDMIPYSLAFVYFYYLKDPLSAAKYYKVASAIEWSIEWAKVMSAIMQGKWWEREKSIYMFLSMSKSIEENQVCEVLASELENIMNGLSSWQLNLNWELIKAISETRTATFWEFDENNKEAATSDTSCQSYINKATRELNLLYLELANEAYIQEKWEPALTWKALLEAWFIDYNPIDFQQHSDYWIQYDYNPDTQKFDYNNGWL